MTIPLSDIAVELIKLLAPLALTGVTWAMGQMAMFLKARTGSVTAATATLQLNDLFVSIVTDLQQTLVPKLKSASGGVLTDADKQTVKQVALDRVTQLAVPGMLSIALRALGIDPGQLASYISTRLESTVFAVKNGATPALPPFLSGPAPGGAYNQHAGEIQGDGSTSTGLPPFLAGPPPTLGIR